MEALTDGEPAAEFGDRTSPDSGEGATGIDDTWRPSPARPRPRIRRPAPARRTVLRPGSADTVESRAASPEAVAAAGPAAAVGSAAVDSAAVDSGAVGNETASSEAVGVSTAPEPPLGILIGGRRAVPGSVGRAAEQRFRRVTAQLIRVGRGTTLAVLPSWRPSIAISVPTELLLAATGLSYEELGRAELTVLINFDALHDRELRPREWQVTPDHGGGRRRRG